MDVFGYSISIIHKFKTSGGLLRIYCHSHPSSIRKTNDQLHVSASTLAAIASKNINFKIYKPGLV